MRIPPEDETIRVKVSRAQSGLRLDVLVSQAAGVSRTRAQALIEDGSVLVDGAIKKKNYALSEGETVTCILPVKVEEDLIPEDLPITIIYEDADIIVVDKPPGIVMYPSPGHPHGTLLNALISRYPEISQVGGKGRPGVFHRLDRDTSGLLALARSDRAYRSMVQSMKRREVKRGYISLVRGKIDVEKGLIDAPIGRDLRDRKRMAVRTIGGRKAVTRFEVLETFGSDFSLVRVFLETGRTHQIRVHFSFIGHPVVGDRQYARGRAHELDPGRQFLHACCMEFCHPVSGKRLSFESPLPKDLSRFLELIRVRYENPA